MSLVYIVHIFIHPSTGHFHTLAIVNNATTNMGVTDISLRLHFLWIYSQKWIAGSYGSFLFNLLRNLHTVFHTGHTFIFPPTVYEGSLFFTFLPVLLSPVFLIIAILTDEGWYLIVVWICISLMISETEHLSIYLLAICMSSLGKCLLGSFDRFLKFSCFLTIKLDEFLV